MRPLIGITCNFDRGGVRYTLAQNYVNCVLASGGLPFLLPYLPEGECSNLLLELLDGLVLSGGGDVDPCYFNQEPFPGCGEITPERDAFEIKLVQMALARDLPILGICRGMQVLNIAAGGDIYQDINSQLTAVFKHFQQAPAAYPTHSIEILPGTRLAAIAGAGRKRVNSFHHQAVNRVAPGFVVAAVAGDGVIEALEAPQKTFVLGVQWHVESMYPHDRGAVALWQSFIAAAQMVRQGKEAGR